MLDYKRGDASPRVITRPLDGINVRRQIEMGVNKRGQPDCHQRMALAWRCVVIDQALIFLRDTLNAYLTTPAPGQAASAEEAVVFLDGDKTDPISFRVGAVTVLLINVEQEPILRAANPYQRVGADGTAYQVRPDIRLNLSVMFVARFKQYEQALAALSRTLTFFQSHPVLDARTAPSLPVNIPQLTMELLTVPLNEQNDLWNALRAAFQPSLLYRVRMLVFQDQQAAVTGPVTGAPQRELANASGATS